MIQRAREAGEPFSAIAKTLSRNPSTISREWRRNSQSGRYEAGDVQQGTGIGRFANETKT